MEENIKVSTDVLLSNDVEGLRNYFYAYNTADINPKNTC